MQSVQLAASELWVTLIFFAILYLFREGLRQKTVTKLLLIVCTTRLVSDAVSWAFDGVPGLFLGVLTKISNYVTFVSNDAISLVFSVFIWQLIRRKDQRPDVVLKIYWALEAVTIGALTLNLHFGWFYSFDSGNGYSRGPYYRLTHVAAVAALVVVLWLLLNYHRRFSQNQKFLVWSYLVLMAGATIYEYMTFGLSLQTYAQTLSALIAFLIGEIELRQELLLTQEKLKQSNQELQKEEKKAEAASVAKSNFLFNMSHDIRTPMNAILGYTQLIKRELDKPDELDQEKLLHYQEKVEHSGNLLLSIINNVLDMARIESGKMELKEEYCDTEAIRTELMSVFESDAQKKQIHLESDWQVPYRHLVVDQTKIKEIFLNLISNAIKYTPEGGTVSIRAVELPSDRAGYLCVQTEIADTGIGMSQAYLPQLFEPFTRERNSTTKVIGTGLGMPIVKKLVELMGGSIQVESELGKGTRFTLTLYHRLADGPYAPQESRLSAVEKKTILQGKRILLAEDNDLHAVFLMQPDDVSFAVRRGDSVLLSILNKTLKTMPSAMLTGALTTYDTSYQRVTASDFIKDNLAGVTVAFVSVFLVIFLVILMSWKRAKTSEETAKKAMQLAEEANAAKSNFLFNMSHDIRTPMSAILGFTALAEKTPDDPALVKSYLEKIQISGQGMLSILDNVLELSRIEAGKTTLEEAPQEAGTVFDTCMIMMSPEIEKKHHTVTVEKKIDIPYVFFDATRVTEIVMNILSNAIKYTANGGRIACTMAQTPHPDEGWVYEELSVADTGIGMSEEFQKHIFDTFARERSTTLSGIQGTGLGMGIVKRLVELMGGTVTVQSKLGKGTTVHVKLPMRIATQEECQPQHSATPSEKEALHGKRILLAEDNDLNAEIATALLEEEGLLVDRAADGVQCVEKLEHAAPGYYALILMDVQMPVLDGYQATAKIRKLNEKAKAEIPIIAMTANAFSEDRAQALAVGMNDHVAKPINMNILTEVLVKYIVHET